MSDTGIRPKYEIARDVISTLLGDQISRSDSLNSSVGVLAGLGGVVVTLAAIVPKLTGNGWGVSGISLAGLSVVIAVVGLLVRRPGREPKDPEGLVRQIIATEDASLTEDVLLYFDVGAAGRNERRLKWKGVFAISATASIAAGVVLIVFAIIQIRYQ